MSVNEKLRSAQHDELFEGILQLQTVEECYAFFEDICTVNELKALSQRLQVAKMLRAGDSYEMIVEETGASTATISRHKIVKEYVHQHICMQQRWPMVTVVLYIELLFLPIRMVK